MTHHKIKKSLNKRQKYPVFLEQSCPSPCVHFYHPIPRTSGDSGPITAATLCNGHQGLMLQPETAHTLPFCCVIHSRQNDQELGDKTISVTMKFSYFREMQLHCATKETADKEAWDVVDY